MTQFLLTNFGEARLTEPVDEDDTVFRIDPVYADRFPSPVGDQAFALTLWDGTQPQEICYCYSNPLDGYFQVTRAQESTTPRAWLAGTMVRHFLTAATSGAIFQSDFINVNKATQAEAEAGVVNNKVMTPENTTQFWNVRTTDFSQEFLLATDAVSGRRVLGWETSVFSGTGVQASFTLPSTDYATPYTKVYINEVYQATGYTISGNTITFTTPPPIGVDNVVVVLGQDFATSISFPGNNTVGTPQLVDAAVTSAKLATNSVTSAKIVAASVTYAKIQNVSATDKILGRFSAGAGGIEELTISDYAQGFISAADQAAAQLKLETNDWPVPTGFITMMLRSATPTGWLICNGGTIGNAGSGATRRANVDTKDLFTHIWASTNTTDYPIQTSTGVVTTKGASADADFTAQKRLTIPDMRGYFPRGFDDGAGVDAGRTLGSTQADAMLTHGHTASANTTGAHTHSYGPVTAVYGLNGQSYADFRPSAGDSNRNQVSLTTDSQGAHTHTITVNNYVGASEVRPTNRAFRYYIKL